MIEWYKDWAVTHNVYVGYDFSEDDEALRKLIVAIKIPNAPSPVFITFTFDQYMDTEFERREARKILSLIDLLQRALHELDRKDRSHEIKVQRVIRSQPGQIDDGQD